MMNEQSKPGNPSAPVILPAKRRRGRPRKDGGVPKRGSSLTPATSAPEMVKKTQAVEVNQVDGTVENMVGRMVSGVIDGCFDAGYFLTVRVGNSNTLLRGVVFQPGRFAPISASNDVAPQAKMYQRRDLPVPVPVPNLQGQNDGMIPQSDKLVKQPVQLGPQPAMDAPQVLPSKPTSSDTFVLNNQMNQPPSVMVPQSGPFSIQMTNMSRGGSGFPFGGKIMVHQNPDQRLQIQSQPGHRPENLGMVEHDEVMQVFELSTQSEMPKVGLEGDKTDILPNEGTSNQLSQTHNQALGSMAQQCFMSYNLEQSNSRLPQNPAAATVSQTVDSESQDVESEMEKSQFDSGEVRHPNHEQHETPINSQPPPVQEKPSAMESGPFVHSEAVEIHQTPVVAELQFISQEPEAAESELKPSDPNNPNNPNNELKSPVPVHHQDQTLEKLGTTQTPQPLEVEHTSPNFECHHNPAVGNTQNVHQDLMNDAMDFMMEKPASPKNNATQHSPEGKPMSDPAENAMRGPQFSLESTGQILTLGIGGSDNPGRFDTQFYNQVSGTTDFGFVLGDFVPPTGSHGNPNNMPETQHR